MDFLNRHTGVLFCSVDCAHEHHEGGPRDEIVPLEPEEYEACMYGCFCPVCLQPYEGYLLSEAGQASTDLHLSE